MSAAQTLCPTPDAVEACQAIVIGIDQIVHAAEQRWGIGRLPLLVSDATRLRFRRATQIWHTAIKAWDVAKVEPAAAMMRRAWPAMEREAEHLGAAPLSPDVWEVSLQPDSTGYQRVARIVRTREEAFAISKAARDDVGREVSVFTLDEVARILGRHKDLWGEIVMAFPGAQVRSTERVFGRAYAQDWIADGTMLDIRFPAPQTVVDGLDGPELAE